MKLSQNQIRFIINCDVETLVSYLQEDFQLSLLEAFDKVYNSQTYQRLINLKTGLYLQSPDYIYGYLTDEISS